MTDLELATKIVRFAFSDRKDLAGKPYFDHLQRVTKMANDWGGGDVKTVAMLHDLLEDCEDWTEGALRALFSASIVDTIMILTRGVMESYDDYIDRIYSSGNQWAIHIKICDLKDNMDITRYIREITDTDFQRIKKYHKAYNKLSGR